MQRDLPRQRGAAAGFTFEAALENESEVLDALLAALARNQLPPEAWVSLHRAAARDDRVDQLAQAYAAVAHGKRIRTLSPALAADFLHHAGTFFAEVANDPLGSIDYWQRALVASPTHAEAFARLESALIDAGQRRAQADLYIAQAHHRPRPEQPDLLRRAASLLEGEPDTVDVLLEQYQEILRLDPRDDETRGKLEARYLEANRPRDVSRLLEQALVSEPPPTPATALDIRTRLVQLYAGPLNELERSMPHVEAILQGDPEHDEARTVARRLLEVRSLAGRAAAALAQATEATGTPGDVAKMLLVELEHTRGPKRREVLRRLGILRQDRLGDDPGAYEAFEQALALDATDEEVLRRYLVLATTIGKELDAGRALARFGAAARDPQARARLSAAVGQLYLAGGDPKRARASFVSVLAMPDVPADVQLRVSRALCAIYASDRDFRSLADSLERVALLEPDPDLRQTANEELAELAQSTLRDAARAVIAWRRLVDTPARRRALDALEPLYAATGNAVDLAYVLEERAKDEVDVDVARDLAYRAAEVLTLKAGAEYASESWARFSARFGADRQALAHWIPLLEAQEDWQRLPLALEADASLAPEEERVGLLVRLGQVRLQRAGDAPGAIEAFAQAMAIDPTDSTSRAILEKLASAGPERLMAAEALEPHYRAEQHLQGLMRVLDLRATESGSPEVRVHAIVEALEISEALGGARVVEWLERGLAEAVLARGDVHGWLEPLAAAIGSSDRRRYAAILSRALGELQVDSEPLLLLAQRAAEAQLAAEDPRAALALYRRALAFAPTSADLLARVDGLLEQQGAPAERVALYREALVREVSQDRRRELHHRIAGIERSDLQDLGAAISTYEEAAAEDAADADAASALVGLYTEAKRWESLLGLLGRLLTGAGKGEAPAVRAQIAEVSLKMDDAATARQQADAVLADDGATDADVAVIERVATALGDTVMLRAVLARRAVLAPESPTQVVWLDRLGALEVSCGDAASAVATWKRAATIAEESGDVGEARRIFEAARAAAPDDVEIAYRLADLFEQVGEWSKLPDLYALMLRHSELPSARIAVLMRHARLLAEHLDDMPSALVSAAQAFELASGSPEYKEVLSTFTMLALRGKATHIFAQAMDDGILRNSGDDADQTDRRTDLRMAKARVLAANRDGRDSAVAAYRAILEDAGTGETQLKSATHALESLLSSEPAEGRRDDRRWLFAWRAARVAGAEQAAALEAWAQTEEVVFRDPEQALDLYRRCLAIEPENPRALPAVARLSLAVGDAEGAVRALTAQRGQALGDERALIDIELAKILLRRLRRPGDAVAVVSELVRDAARAEGVLELAGELLAEEAARDQMASVLDAAQQSSEDPAVRARILKALLDAQKGVASAESRGGWFESLLAIRRGNDPEGALALVLEAALEQPETPMFWDQAEQLARELSRAGDVADAYARVLSGSLTREAATFLGERAVALQEEWFEDTQGVVKILERVLDLDPGAEWAFSRLKMIFDAGERWTELFALYDRAILSADDARKAGLYEDAAQIAKDFANDSDRAVDYLEKLFVLRPSDTRLVASLERLYERKGAHRQLVGLLTQQLASQRGDTAQRTRARMAELWLEDLKEPERALVLAEEMLEHAASASSTTDPPLDPIGLLERVMAAAPRVSPGTQGAARPVRYRAAARLRTHYEALGRDAELARLFEIELEIATSPAELVHGHRQIATFHRKLGDLATALEHVATLALLEPEVAAHRKELSELATEVGRYDRLADTLVKVSEKAASETLRAELMTAAGDVWAEHLHDDERATAAYVAVLAAKDVPSGLSLEAARKVEPLLERANRAWDLLDVLERLAALEDTGPARARAWTFAARLATSLGDLPRAIVAWEARLEEEVDAEALDAIIVLLERESRWEQLLKALARRIASPRTPEERYADRVRSARIHERRLGDLDRAVAEWAAAEAAFGATTESTDALCDLLEKTNRWAELEDKIAQAASQAETDERRASLRARHGDVIRIHRADARQARASYEAALVLSPSESLARSGLLAIAASGTDVPEVVRSLLVAYNATDDWRAVLELTPLRLAAAAESAAQRDVLIEAAGLAETRADDAGRAFELLLGAFDLAPDREDTAVELARLAEVTGGWQAYVDAHERALARSDLAAASSRSFGDPHWRAAFRYRLAGARESHLADALGALREYERASLDSPAEDAIALSAIRLAAQQLVWGTAAAALLRLASAAPSKTDAALAAAEEAAAALRSWDDLTRELAKAVGDAPDLRALTLRDIEARIAIWHRDRRGDPEAAEAALTRALVHDPANTSLLSSLASLQRRAKGRPLVDSLLHLSDATGGDLELLREAGEVAISPLADRALAKSILESVLRLSQQRWLPSGVWSAASSVGSESPPDGPVSVGAPTSPAPIVRWAIAELAKIHEEEGQAAQTVDMLTTAAKLPWDASETRDMLHDAARLARVAAREPSKAVQLLEGLFDSDPTDLEAVTGLTELYTVLDRPEDLLRLHARLIAQTEDPARRVELRLASAKLELSLKRVREAVTLLRQNLVDAPRDPATVASLAEVFTDQALFRELADLYATQADSFESALEHSASATFSVRAAEVAESKLDDVPRAIKHYRRALALEETATTLDALARLLAAHGDHGDAATMLERLLARDADSTAIILRLVEQLTLAGQPVRAREELERGFRAKPDDVALRDRLVQLFTAAAAWGALADLHRSAAERAGEKSARLGHLRAAADLFTHRTETPELAIPLLEQASELEPEDRGLRLLLADALVHAGRFDEARALLRSIIDGFAGRRPKERGVAHFHLAQLEIAMGNRAQALLELDSATKIDPGNAKILRSLAELARADGQIDRAERSYRALLVALKRPEDAAEGAEVVRSEVLLELSSIAAGQGQPDRAHELVESALESASKSVVEGRRLEAALREKGEFATLVRALEARLGRATEVSERGEVLTELARVLDVELGHLAGAFAARQKALALTPLSEPAHEASLSLARRVDGVRKYLDDVSELAVAAARDGRPLAAGELYLRLGRATEQELSDDEAAARAYERALEASSEVTTDAPRATRLALATVRSLDLVYGRLGRTGDRRRVLARRVALESVTDDPKDAADARYRLAELTFATPDGSLEGGLLVRQALELDRDLTRAEAVVRVGLSALPEDDGLLDLLEVIGREDGHEGALLEALSARASASAASPEIVREAGLLARRLGELDRAEKLLAGFVERADGQDVGWAFEELATLRETAGDAAGAIRWKERAVETALGTDARRLRFEIAKLKQDVVGDLAGAAGLYELLFDDDPTDPTSIEPMLAAYRKLGDAIGLARLLPRVIEQVTSDEERTKLRLERVRLLVEPLGQRDEAITQLSDLVADDPNHIEASTFLGELLASTGRSDELRDLLARQIDAAKDRQDAGQVETLSLRRAALIEGEDRDEARATLFSALDWTPESRPVLEHLARLLADPGMEPERVELLERLLKVSGPDEAERAALDLAELRLAEGNSEAAERAWEIGFRIDPKSQALRAHLEAAYRAAEASEKLADLKAIEARGLADPKARAARLCEAAEVYEQIPDLARASALLTEAFELASTDAGLAARVVATLVKAGDVSRAVEVLGRAVELAKDDPARRATLLVERASLRVELDQDAEAAADLSAAARMGAGVIPSLDAELERVRARAEARGDAPVERSTRLELAAVRAEGGDLEGARPLLTELLRREPKDREALRLLARIEERAERWDAATVAYRRLIPLEEGDLAVDTALRLADACERAGRLADARGALERTRTAAPNDQALKLRLERLYESVGAFRELAEMSLTDARAATDDEAKCLLLKRAGSLLLQDGADTEAAIDALVQAQSLAAADIECTLLLADAYTVAGRTDDAHALISGQITSRAGRRSPELASLYHRLARVAHVVGDSVAEMSALTSGLEADAQNGFVAAELASLALELSDIEVATRALRAITLLKDASTSHIPKGVAYQYLGEIARQQGDPKRAMLLLKRAVEEDPSLDDARRMIDEVRAEGG